MRKLNLLAAIAAVSLVGGVAVAKEKAPQAPKEKKICKGEVSSTSRLAKKKVCLTKAEWDARGGQDLGDSEGRLQGISRGN